MNEEDNEEEFKYLTDRQVEVLTKYNENRGYYRSGRNMNATERNIMTQIRKKYKKAKRIIEEINRFDRIREYYDRDQWS